MNHDFIRSNNNINNQKELAMNGDTLAKLEHNVLTNINSLRDEFFNMKCTVIEGLM